MSSRNGNGNTFRHVEIRLRPKTTVYIDSITLRRCSGYFDKSLSEFWLARSPDYVERDDGVVVYELDLQEDPDEDFLMLKVRATNL